MPTFSSPHLARIRSAIASVVGIGAAILIVTILTVPIKGPGYCLSAFRTHYPDLAKSSSIAHRIWARTQDDHWLSALILQPKDISQERFTAVCHFHSTNYVAGPVEIFPGDRTAALKDVSMSNLDPRTWLK